MKQIKLKTIRFKYFTTLLLLFCIFLANGQTDPTPQGLPFSQDFSALAHSSTTYPTGFQGWILGTNSPGTNYRLTPPTGNAPFTANSGASSVSATQVHNYNGKIGFLHSGASEPCLATAIITTGLSNIQVSYTIMGIRNPYDGTTNFRINESILQYRVGTTGNFTNIPSVAYQTNTTQQIATGITTPINPQSRVVTLPSACDNQPVVQLRWVSRDFTGSGSRPSVAIDDITIAPGASITTTGTLAALTTTYGTASTDTSFDVSASALTADIIVTPPAGFEISTSQFSGYATSLTLTQSGGSISTTTIYVRLAETTDSGNYSGNIVLSSGTTSVNVPTTTSIVNTKELTVSGISIADKTFDGNTSATITGTPSLNGIVGSDDVTISGTPTASFLDPAVGNNKPVNVSGYSFTGADAGNYFITQPSGLTGNILPSGLTDQTITFNPLTAATYGDSSFTLTATSDSGLPVSYSSSNTLVATILGDVVTIVGAGTTTITASQAGDSNYNPALPVDQNLVVNTKELTISGASVSDKNYDGTTAATLSGTLTGVVGSDDVTVNLIANFDDALVGASKPVTSASTLSGTSASNYFLTQPTGLTASIMPIPCGTSNGTINWNFTDTTANAINTTQNVAVSPIVGFNGNGTTTYLASGVSSTGYAGASGTINASMACFVGALNTATSTYHEFAITPQPGFIYSVNDISFGSRSSGTGPQLYSIRTSLDGYTSNVTSGALPNNSTWALYTNSGITTLSNISTPITVRIYGSNGTGSPAVNTSNWRIDDVILTVSSAPGSALSSPATSEACSNTTFNYTPTTNYTGASITWTRAAVAGISNSDVTTPQSTNPSEVLVNTTSSPVNVTYAFTVTTSTCFLTQDVIVTVYPTESTSTETACDIYFWSVTGQTYTSTGTYIGTSTNASGCTINETLVLTINNSTSSTMTETACDTYTWAANGQTYTASGTYTHVTTNGVGCPDTATLELTITPSTTNTTTQTACDTYTWSVNNTTYTESGTYSSTTGCHTEVLELTITPSTTNTTTQAACDTYTWSVNNTTYTTSGTYSSTTGCHTELLELTITPSTSNTTTQTACDTYTWSVNNTTYTSSGTYSSTTGCHTEVLELTITPSTSNTTTQTACDTYTWSVNNTTYTASGTYSSTTGCHTEVLELTITPSTSNTTTQTACNLYTWSVNNTTYTESGTYSSTTDCHTEILELTITPSTTNTTTQTACDTYTWSVNNTTYTSSGTYSSTTGCHTEVLELTITPSTSNTTTQTACDTYTWSVNNTTYTESGTYSSTTGCHTEVLELTITPSTTNTTTQTACDTYTWSVNNTVYTASGTYSSTTDCHTEVLELTINNSTSSTLNITSSTPYTWDENGQTYSVSGTYTHVTTNASGCPNTSTLNLVITNGATTVISPTQCGSTLTVINQQIYANLVTGAQGYRFRVTDMTTNQVQTIDRILRVFQLTQLTNYAFNRTYQVEVAVKISNVWQSFGSPCNVTTPVATTQVQSAQCGSTLTTINDVIYANNIPYAVGYKFRITNLLTSAQQEVERPLRDIRMTQTSIAEFNTTYSIEVAVRNTDGTYLPYGTACNVTTPSFPTTQLQLSQCDVIVTNMNTIVYADSYSGATTYRFKFTNTSLGYNYQFDRSLRSFSLSSVPGLLPGETYSVQVSIEVGGEFGPFGKVCTITTPGATRENFENSKSVIAFNAVASPNPFKESFKLEVSTSSDDAIQLKVYDVLGRTIESRDLSVSSIADLEIGTNLPSGVYNVILTQGKEVKALRMIKK